MSSRYKTMISCGALAFVATVYGVSAEPQVAKNLLTNSSFETASEEHDQASGWSRWGPWINREDSWAPTHEGKALIGYHHWQVESADDSGLWQDVTVTPGQTYQFTLFANRDDPGTGHGAESIELRLEASANDHQTTINTTTVKVADLAVGEKWSTLTVKGKATGTTLRVLIRVVPAKDGPRGGALKCDDATLVEIRPS